MNEDTASSTMFEDVVTMIRILSLIPQDRWTTVAEIHQELEDRGVEIHRRTLQRYLKTIRDHSDVFPIHVETSGKPYGFCWDPQSAGFHLPQLGVEQMLLLRIAEERLQSHLPPQAITPIRPLLRSARRVIKYDDETEGTWLRKVKVLEDAQSFQPPVIRPGVLSAIADALFIDHKVLLRCRSARSRNTEVIVRPLAIIQKGVRTYLVYQTDAGDFQHIALNRLDAAELMQDAFEHPENFDLEDYSAKIRLNDARGKTMRLSITSDDPEFVRILSESPFNQTQKIEDEPGKTGSWVITAVVEDSLLLDGWLAEHRGSIISSTKTALRQEEATASKFRGNRVGPAGGRSHCDAAHAADRKQRRKALEPPSCRSHAFRRRNQPDSAGAEILRSSCGCAQFRRRIWSGGSGRFKESESRVQHQRSRSNGQMMLLNR